MQRDQINIFTREHFKTLTTSLEQCHTHEKSE